MFIIEFLIALIVVIAVIAAMRPDIFSVTRQAAISAPPEKIFSHVNDFHAWEAWSPWAKLDPNAKTTFEGSNAGVGAIMRWEGNMKVGKGSMTITESRPGTLIKLRLEFLKPMKATNTADFTFRPEGGQTIVIWSMQGKNNYMGKVMSLVFNCQKMVSGQFDRGLASLKSVAETGR